MDLVSAIVACLLKTWQFRKFTESRWLTVGTSCRVLSAAILTGIDDLYRTIMEDVDGGTPAMVDVMGGLGWVVMPL